MPYASQMSDLERPSPPPGWYPDVSGHQRWWDGREWGVYAPVVQGPPASVNGRPVKDVGVAYLLAILLGGLAAHHFYLGNVGIGILYLALWVAGWATVGIGIGVLLVLAVAVWWVIDLFLIPRYVKAANAPRISLER